MRQDRPGPADAALLATPLAGPVVTVAPAGLRPAHAARYIGVSLTFLRSLPVTPLRVRGNGPRGKPLVIYLRSDLDRWLDAQAAQRDPPLTARTRTTKAS